MKKHFKSVLASVLALALTGSVLAAPSMADTSIYEETGTGNVDIVVDYQAPTDNLDEIESGENGAWVYSVILEWEPSGQITYNAGKTNYSWNQDDLKYDSEVTNKGWTLNNAKVTITAKNRSNRPVKIECDTPDAINGVEITGTYNQSSFELDSAAPNDLNGVGTEKTAQAVYSITGVEGDISSSTTNIATIKVTVTGK